MRVWAVALIGLAAGAMFAGSDRLTPQQAAQLNTFSMPVDLNRGAAGLARCLLELRTRASLLMVVAHPDDEDGGLLVYQARHVGARTALLTLTRGEGGQNVMSGDLYDALGLVRTQELMQADRFYGTQQFWGTVIDYGFSKTREEALEKWGYERVLSDAVAGGADDAAAGGHVRIRGRAHRWARESPGGRADRAGSVQCRGRSKSVSRADSRRPAPVEASESVRARSFLRADQRKNHLRLCNR